MEWVRKLVSTGQRRTDSGWQRHVIHLLAFLTALWSIYQAVWTDLDVMAMTIIFLSLALTLTFLTFTPTESARTDRIPFYDYLFAAVAIGAGLHFGLKVEEIATRISLFDELTVADMFFSSAMLLLLVEASRRTVGIDMAIVVLIFFFYNLYGPYMPGFIAHKGVSYTHFLDVAFFTTDGVFGIPLRVAATYAFLFVIFGTILTKCGGGEFFYRLSAAISGRRAGGPAKVAVVSSGLFGSVSGNPVADVVTTGSVTIPIMIRSGVKPVYAAGVEATASTGGSMMPPVMGTAAFIMAEFTAIPYSHIAAAALIPALLYYVSLYAQVHFYARRNGLRGMERHEIPRLLPTMRADWPFLIPIAVLIGILMAGYSPSVIAFWSTVAVVAAATLRKSTRLSFRDLYFQLVESTERMLPVAVTCAAAGLVLAGMTMTGLAFKFNELIHFISGSNFIIALITAAVMTTLLGLGLPTSGTYILAAVLMGKILTGFGASVLQAHMFLLYYAALSALTPPVAIASYAAAALANTNPFITSLYSMRKAAVAFLVPFGFIAHSGLLLQGAVWEIAIATLLASLGALLMAAAFERFYFSELRTWERVVLGLGGMLLLVGNYELQALGAVLGLAGVARDGLAWLAARRGRESKAPSEVPSTSLEEAAPERSATSG